jgi:2,3-bisphosphoglycerate-dependent phosphoglycerate mutase
MKKVVLLRHGESAWNRENRFTGWVDVPLSAKGEAEARESGRLLKEAGFAPDLAYTSVLKRAIKTLWLGLEELDRMWIPVTAHWRLNERHYGDLQGLNKAETAARFGDEQVLIWRRSYDVPPPAMSREDERFEGMDPRYAGIDPLQIPTGESLKDTVTRVVPYWDEVIAPQVRAGRQVLVAAHGNSLRALIKHLLKIDEKTILGMNIPTGVPLVLELDDEMNPLGHRYLGDPEEAARKAQAVANQGKAGR